MDVASHQHLKMSMAGRHGVVVTAIPHQGKRVDPGPLPSRRLRTVRWESGQQRSTVTLEAFADGLGMSTQSPLSGASGTVVRDAR